MSSRATKTNVYSFPFRARAKASSPSFCSSSFISDVSGYAVQHLQYLPFGETMVDLRMLSTFNSRYTFSGKEKDDETQYSYFGARYYDSDLSVWLSVDPMADKYPSMSPFMYCAGNPVMLVDPDGRFPISPSFRENYPLLTKFIESKMQSYIENSPRINNVLLKYSGGQLTINQIKNDFKKEGGPTITNKTYETYGGSIITNGEYDYQTNTITFSDDFLKRIENTLKSTDGEKKTWSMMSFLKLFVEEYVHYGDALDGLDLEMDQDGNWANNPDSPEPTAPYNKDEEGGAAAQELYPCVSGRQNYYYYKNGTRISPTTGKPLDSDPTRIDETMIPLCD